VPQFGESLNIENEAMTANDCVFCDLTNLRGADVYFENAYCVALQCLPGFAV
jgi:hypothetical protein